MCCISLFSYIKPQLTADDFAPSMCCISLFSYIKPQQYHKHIEELLVVYLCFPTSNRNPSESAGGNDMLYIFVFLHQTATVRLIPFAFATLYIFVFLHQTATSISVSTYNTCCISLFSYIKPQLGVKCVELLGCCISLFSYIKPQLLTKNIFPI